VVEQRGNQARKDGGLKLRSTSKAKIVPNIFHNPSMPSLDDYYEPWTYDYQNLFNAPEGDDQPTARPISMIDGRHIDIKAGPNWDDDLSGSPIYAENDPNLEALTDEQKAQLFAIERLVFFYFPRICNHCLNPACVASCPSGALHKRGEDGIVLIDQKICRAWRSCISACPYKKTYFNWQTGKSEKCILCFPRVETGQAPACFHSCVGRIRYLGVLLYDADRIEELAKKDDGDLVHAHRSLILDPRDPAVIDAAKRNGIAESTLDAARRSPVYKFVKEWGLALPPHIEYRTFPMLFYVPPLLPVISKDHDGTVATDSDSFFHDTDKGRMPVEFLGSLFGGGNTGVVSYALRKLMAVRHHRRELTVGDVSTDSVEQILREADLTREQAEEIYRLTTLCTVRERYVIPPAQREQAIEMIEDPLEHKQAVGFGFLKGPRRGI